MAIKAFQFHTEKFNTVSEAKNKTKANYIHPFAFPKLRLVCISQVVIVSLVYPKNYSVYKQDENKAFHL